MPKEESKNKHLNYQFDECLVMRQKSSFLRQERVDETFFSRQGLQIFAKKKLLLMIFVRLISFHITIMNQPHTIDLVRSTSKSTTAQCQGHSVTCSMSVGLASQIDLKSTFTIMTISFRRRQKFVSSIRRRFILSTVLFLCGICIIPTLPHLLHVFWLVQCPAIMLN